MADTPKWYDKYIGKQRTEDIELPAKQKTGKELASDMLKPPPVVESILKGIRKAAR